MTRALLVLLMAFLVCGCVPTERERQLGLVPEALRVTSVVYSAEIGHGIGPGANETGIVVYEMPAAFRRALEDEGFAHLGTLAMPLRDGTPTYDRWQATPVKAEPDWPRQNYRSDAKDYRIRDYTDQFMINEMDASVEAMVNSALTAPGSYYVQHKWRIALIVLIPSERRIIFAYSG